MWEIIKTSLPQLLAAGFKYTIPLAIISFFFGLIIALVTALIRLSRQRGAFMILKWIASFYVWLFRSTPLLVQLFIVFFGLPYLRIKGVLPHGIKLEPFTAGIITFSLNTGAYASETIFFGLPYLRIKGVLPHGIKLEPFTAGIITFSLNTGAYASEIIRAAISSVPTGQWEAGAAIGMTRLQILWRIILPQALRVALPPLSNSFISLVKDTSLAASITIMEIYASEIIRAAISSVPTGQWEAGAAIGMTRLQILWRIILPQALRVALPPLSNSFISLVKDTSLAASITIMEMFAVSQQIAAENYQPLLMYTLVAMVYAVFTTVLSYFQGYLERVVDRQVNANNR